MANDWFIACLYECLQDNKGTKNNDEWEQEEKEKQSFYERFRGCHTEVAMDVSGLKNVNCTDTK